MSIASRVKSFLNRTEHPLWWSMASAAFVSITVAIISIYFNYQMAIEQKKTELILRNSAQFESEFSDFAIEAGSLTQAIIDQKRVDPELRERVIKSLKRQANEIDDLARLLGPKGESAVRNYQDTVFKMIDVTKRLENRNDLREFFETAKKMRHEKEVLMESVYSATIDKSEATRRSHLA